MNSDTLLSLVFWQTVQVTVVAFLVLMANRLFAKDRPHFAHAMWALVLLKCLTPPLIPSPTSPFSWLRAKQVSRKTVEIEAFPVPFEVAMSEIAPPLPPLDYELARLPATDGGVHSEDGLVAAAAPAERTAPQQPAKSLFQKAMSLHWAWISCGIWVAGSVVVFSAAVFRFVRFVRSIRKSAVTTPPSLADQTRELCERLKIRPVRVLVVDQPTGPAILGLLNPTIVLPNIVVSNSTSHQLEPMLAHELVHFRRGDLWWSAIQVASVCLWWCHPLIWIASRFLSREAERSCDEETIAALGCSPALYARSLLSVLEQKQQLRASPLLPGIRPVDLTAKRMERIMRLGQGCHRRCPAWVWGTFMLGAVTLLPGAALVLAQEESEEPKERPPRVLRKLVKPLPMAPYLPNGREASDGFPSLESTKVDRLLDRAMRELNLDRDVAEQMLLDRLGLNAPDKNMPEQIEFTVSVGNEKQCQVSLGGREARAKICNGLLYVFESEKQHTRVRSILEDLAKKGFVQFSIEVEVFRVPDTVVESWSPSPPEVVHASHPASATASLRELTAELEEALLLATRSPGTKVSRIAGPRMTINNGCAGMLQSGDRLEVEIPGPDGYHQREVDDGFRLEVNVTSVDGPHDENSGEPTHADKYASVVLKFRQGWLDSPNEIGEVIKQVAIPASHFEFFECKATLPVAAGAPASFVQLPPSETDQSGMTTLVLLRCHRLPQPAPEVTIQNELKPDDSLFKDAESISEEQLRQAWVSVSGKLSDADYEKLIEEYAKAGIEKYRRVDGVVQVIALQGDDTLQRTTWKRALKIYEKISAAKSDSNDEGSDSNDQPDSGASPMTPTTKSSQNS
ncbi:MAG: M56 family metallopeptidase, partial [Planctomycetota bacterium]